MINQIIISDDEWNGAVVSLDIEGTIKMQCKQEGWKAEWYDIPEQYQFADAPEGYTPPQVSPVSELAKPKFLGLF